MKKVKWLAAGMLVLGGVSWAIAQGVPVPGSKTRYPMTAQANVNGKAISLVLTGVAMRTKFIANVYAIGSYVQAGVQVRNVEDLAGTDCVKQLHLIMEREVDGADMAGAFQDAIRRNYPAPAFEAEVKQLADTMRAHSADRGDHIVLTHIPGVGLHCHSPGKINLVIRNPKFSRAVWDIYLGRRNLGEKIKDGLASLL